MPKVRLSGTITGSDDPNREVRAKMLYQLFSRGWDIYNSNGDQRITLSNIERKIVEANAFIFMPGASLEDLFKAISIFVGYQTLDPNLSSKATVILNADGTWTPMFNLLGNLHTLGTIRQNYRNYLLETANPEGVLSELEKVQRLGVPDPGRTKVTECSETSYDTPLPAGSTGNVCIFCSASIEDESYLEDGYALGRELAMNQMGCVSGAGTTGVMGAVVRGSVDAGGWTGGSNVPHIIELEGLPEGLSSFWLRNDIYTRMEAMIENSDAFVIFPGGAGTVQEMLALLIFKQMNHPCMMGKPVILYNRLNPDGSTRFWDKLIDLLEPWENDTLYTIVEDLDAIVPATKGLLKHKICAS
ncbi:LOG family protein [Coraliomargarita parva]|uniref:LOG family protein n=1 Tax=Coraliomargarita parva TaxID=3014050 RepID=UPI0022B44C3E|nr:LOG family protein [Coraliomargarita parva]